MIKVIIFSDLDIPLEDGEIKATPCPRRSGGRHVVVDIMFEQVVRRHFVLLAAGLRTRTAHRFTRLQCKNVRLRG